MRNLSPKSETGVAVVFAVFLLAVLLLTMCGCTTTKKVVGESVTIVHDTLFINKVDTVRDFRIVTQHDTTHNVIERIVTLKEGGDTLRIVTNNVRERVVYRNDSSDRYRAALDSVKSAIKDIQKTKSEVTKVKPSWREQILIALVLVSTTLFLLLLLKTKKEE